MQRLSRLEQLERQLAAPPSAGVELRLRDLCGSRPSAEALDGLLGPLKEWLDAEPLPQDCRPPAIRLLGALLVSEAELAQLTSLHDSCVQSTIRAASNSSE